MATTSPILGNNLYLYLAGTAIAHSRGCTFSASADEIDITTKDCAKAYAMLPGTVKATISAEGLIAITNDIPLLEKLKAGTSVAWKFSTNTSGDKYMHGATAYIVSIDHSGPYNAEATYSISMVVSGTWAVSSKT